MSKRSEKMAVVLREAAAQFLVKEAGPQSLITVTNATISDDGHRGVIFLSVLPLAGQSLAGQADSAEQSAIEFANRNRKAFGEFFEKRVRGMRIPHVEFVIDKGEKNRRRLDELGQ